MADVILHAFNWTYREVATEAGAIAGAGYGAVLLPPPLYSDPASAPWWQRYQPKDYRVLRSYLGNRAELEEAITSLHEAGVRVFADIVFNHMANEKGARPDPYFFPGEGELARYHRERQSFLADLLYGDLDSSLFTPEDFNREGDIRNWIDRQESQEHDLSGLPDLELNERVVTQQRACLAALNRLGFDGYRIDAVKHLPDAHIIQVFQTEEMAGKLLFGEALTANDQEERLFLWPLLERTTISYYDFPLFETLRRVFAPAGSLRELVDPAALGQALAWNRGVTFSVTHDIPYNDGFRWQLLDRQDEYLANAYLLGRDGGLPLVFSDHNESAGSYGQDRDRWAGAWQRADTVGMIAFHNKVHGAPQHSLWEADGFLVFGRGEGGIVAINKTAEWQQPTIATARLRQGRYVCQLHGHAMEVRGDRFTFAIPPRQAQLWLAAGS
jgi:alpha-amylase